MTERRTTWQDALKVTNLKDAKDAVSRLTPPPDASADQHHEYHLRAAEVYLKVAEIDTRHRHEATAYAVVEQTIYAPKATRR